MKILVTNHHFSEQGGSETWTYCFICNLKKLNFDVDLYIYSPINKHGMLYLKTKENNIQIYERYIPKKKYDLILANHNSTIYELLQYYNKKKKNRFSCK